MAAEERVQTAAVQQWNKHFYCPLYHQRLTLKICCHRFAMVLRGAMVHEGVAHPEIAKQYASCEHCYVRIDSCSRFRKPNKPHREPNIDKAGRKLLRKLINRRLAKYGEI